MLVVEFCQFPSRIAIKYPSSASSEVTETSVSKPGEGSIGVMAESPAASMTAIRVC